VVCCTVCVQIADWVSCSTESYDEMGDVGADPRWEVFQPLHDYLLGAFPLVSVFDVLGIAAGGSR